MRRDSDGTFGVDSQPAYGEIAVRRGTVENGEVVPRIPAEVRKSDMREETII